MQTLTEIRQLLSERGLSPNHRLGQNFLHDKNQLQKLVAAANLRSGDRVLEIGPGTGTLTEALIEVGARVIACELDSGLADLLTERIGKQITLIRGDCLAKQRRLNSELVAALGDQPFKLVANLPYQVATPLISALLMDHSNCVGLFVTIQREVADRLEATTGTKEYGPLTIIVQAYARVHQIGTVSPSCFWPIPEVHSAMVSILPSPLGRGAGGEGRASVDSPRARRNFARFVTEVFTKRRKQLGTVFGRDESRYPEGIFPSLRPEALTVDQHIALWQAMSDS